MPAKGFQYTHCKRGHELSGDNVYYVPAASRGNRGRRGCKACRQVAIKRYFSANPEKTKEYNRTYRERHPDKPKWHTRKSKALRMGLSVEEFEQLKPLLENGDCEICGKRGPLVLDHDHYSGVFCGLLCRLCNQGIGSLGHNTETLRNAAEYIERTRNASSKREAAAVYGGGASPETSWQKDEDGNVRAAA